MNKSEKILELVEELRQFIILASLSAEGDEVKEFNKVLIRLTNEAMSTKRTEDKLVHMAGRIHQRLSSVDFGDCNVAIRRVLDELAFISLGGQEDEPQNEDV